jgi:2-iminobutanoate/2-iminopropanoate deaminase
MKERVYMSKQVIATARAPAAVGPYSQGIIAGGLVFTAMQIPLVPGSGELASGGIEAQTRQVLDNVQAVLEAAGSSLARAAKVTVYLADLTDFGAVNELYATYFPDAPPARAVVEVAGIPKGALIAMEAVALG